MKSGHTLCNACGQMVWVSNGKFEKHSVKGMNGMTLCKNSEKEAKSGYE